MHVDINKWVNELGKGERGKLFKVECQLKNVGRMMGLDNHLSGIG